MSNFIIEYPGRGAEKPFEQFKYPGGELQVRMRNLQITDETIHAADQIIIRARIKSADDILGLLLLNNAIRGIKPDAQMVLQIPYLPYARADRRFTEGDCKGLSVFGNILGSCHWDIICTRDVHNYRAALSNVSSRIINYPATRFIGNTITDFEEHYGPCDVLYPDKGAADRYPKGTRTHYASKRRNPATGNLEGFTLPDTLAGDRPILIVDDICDGGGTFTGLAAELKKFGQYLGLYTTHGIYSKGFEPLAAFVRLYTTNSFFDGKTTQRLSPMAAAVLDIQYRNPHVTVFDAWADMEGEN